MRRSVVIFRVMFDFSECLAGKPIMNVLWVQLEELRLRKQCIFWVPGKFPPMRVGHQVAERAFIVVMPRHGPVLLDCNRIVLGGRDRDMVGSDIPPVLASPSSAPSPSVGLPTIWETIH